MEQLRNQSLILLLDIICWPTIIRIHFRCWFRKRNGSGQFDRFTPVELQTQHGAQSETCFFGPLQKFRLKKSSTRFVMFDVLPFNESQYLNSIEAKTGEC